MPKVQIKLKLVNLNDIYVRYAGYSINEPLPRNFWDITDYFVGYLFEVGDIVVSEQIDMQAGTYYVVFGTSSPNAYGYWMDVELKIQMATGWPVVSTTQRVHSDQYGYIGFKVDETTITKIAEGTVAPDEAPPITPSVSGGGGQTTEKDKDDISKIIKQMMEDMMPKMIKMMGMMMMMQMMVSMMSTMVSAMAV